MKYNLDSLQYNKNKSYKIRPENEFDGMISLVCDNEALANAIYNGIAASRKRNSFSSEDFNEVLDQALAETRIPVKQCNLALAIFNKNGCFMAQMGDTRVLQIRPISQEIMHDSRSQVLDIYSSKAKVEQIQDIKTDDYFLLCSSDCIDEKSVRKVLCNMINDHDAKVGDLVSLIEKTKDCDGDTPAFVLSRALNVKKSFGINFKKFNPKHFLIALLVLAIAAVGVWAYTSISFGSDSKEVVEVPADSLVSTKASNDNVDTTMVSVPDTIKASMNTNVMVKDPSKIDTNKPSKAKTAAKSNDADIVDVSEIKNVTANETATPSAPASAPAAAEPSAAGNSGN